MPIYFGIPGEPGSEPRSRNEPDRPPVPLELISGREVERPAAPVVEQERPAFWTETLPAAFRQGNLVSSTYDRLANYPGGFQDDPNFDPGEHIEGYEADWKHFVRANSIEEVQFIKDKLAAERADREVLQQAGGLGLATTIAAGVVDPWTLASMMLPAALPATVGTKAAIAAGTAVKLSRAQRVWAAVAANAALDTAGELGMHSSQELRTLSDSLLTIGAGTLLTGAVGTIATRVPKSEFDRVVRALEEAEGKPKPRRILIHGTTAENAEKIRASGRFDAMAGERNYDYSVLGDRTVYFTDAAAESSGGGNLWLGKTWSDRMAPYDAQVTAELAPDARVVVINSVEEANAFAEKMIGENRDLVDRWIREVWGDREPPAFTALQLFSRMMARDGLTGEATRFAPLTDIEEEFLARVTAQVDALDIRPGIASEGIPSDARGWLDMPQVAVLNPEKVLLASETPARAAGSDSFGAARVGADLSLEDEGIATAAGRALAHTLGQVSPQTRALLSPVKAARRLIQELAHIPYLLEKNLKGIAGPEAIEDLVNHQVRRRQVEMRQLMDSAFAAHKAAGGTLTHREFSAAIARELDGIPQPNVPQAAPVVQWARKLLNEDRERIRGLPGYEKFADEMDPDSYFPHVFDKEAILADEAGFKEMLFRDFKENPLIPKDGAVEREKLIAERRQGVSDAAINLEIAEREASEAVQAYEAAKAQLNLARQQAVGRGGAKDMAHRAKRTAQAKRREAAKLKRQLDKLNTRLENMLGETPPRLEAEIDAEMAVKRARRDEVKKSLGGIKAVGRKVSQTSRRMAAKVRSTTARAARLEARVTELLDSGDPKSLRQAEKLDNAAYNMRQQADAATRDLASARSQLDELRGQLDAAKKELDDLGDELFDLRAEKAIGRSQTTAAETLENLRGQKLNRAADAADELRDAEAVAKQLKQRAITARKLARALKRPTKEARKAKIKAERIARKAQIPQRTDAEIRMAVDDTVRNILGDNQVLTAENLHSGANALKSRRLTTAAAKLDPWLVRDAETVLNRYSRRTIPEIELRTRFGTSNMADQIKAVREEFTVLRDAAAGKPNAEKIVKDLAEKETAVVNDLLTVLNRIAGRSAPHDASPFIRKWVRAQRIIRTYNYVRLLGSQTVSSMSDSGRLIARYGLPRTVKGIAKLLVDGDFRRLTKANMRRMGSAFETMFDFRMQQMADLVDEAGAVSRTDKAIEAIGGAFSRLTLMSQWNEMLKVGVAAMEQDALIRKVTAGTLSAFDKAQLVRAGVDDANLDRLADMVRRHADTSEALGRLRTELWEDKQMAALMERHIMSLGDEVVLTRGAGDLPAIMDKEVVKTWLQFRTFAIASVNRTMIPVAQGLAMGDAKMAQGVASMLTLGAMTYYAKERLAGREPDLENPGRLAAEAFNWSGLIAFFPDLWDPIAKTLHIPTFSRFMSRSPSETVGGPTFGSGFNFVAGVMSNLADGTLKQSDIHGIRRMLPFQNLFYFSRLLNAIEGEIGETLGAEGSNRKDFTTRLKEEVPSKEAK